MTRQEIEQVLVAAFPVRPPPPMTLREALLGDQTLARAVSEAEFAAAHEIDAGVTWPDYPDSDLIACRLGVAHLDGISFVYYLPAYLRFALRHLHVDILHPASPTVGVAVFNVTNRSDYALARFQRLSDAQCHAVIAFLEFVAAQAGGSNAGDAQKALSRYWRKRP